MAAKLVTLPKATIEVNTALGKTEKKNTFLHLVSTVIEITPQKTDTETYLAHEVKEKLDSANGHTTIQFEEAELEFIKKSIDRLRAEEKIVGSAWYDVIVPLRDAVFAPKKPKP